MFNSSSELFTKTVMCLCKISMNNGKSRNHLNNGQNWNCFHLLTGSQHMWEKSKLIYFDKTCAMTVIESIFTVQSACADERKDPLAPQK